MRKLILITLVSLIAVSGHGQTYQNMIGAWKKTSNNEKVIFRSSTGDTTVVATPALVSDSLSNYAKIQDGVIIDPTVTTNGDSLIIGNGVVRINSNNVNFIGKTFGYIPASSSGLSRILIAYSDASGLLDTISGMQSNNPVPPNIPINTQRIVTVTVNDAGLGIPDVDLSGYVTKEDLNNETLQKVASRGNTYFNPNATGSVGIGVGKSATLGNSVFFGWNASEGGYGFLSTYTVGTPLVLQRRQDSDMLMPVMIGYPIGGINPDGSSMLMVKGDINITGNYKVNDVPIGSGSGTVTNVSALTLGTSGTDLNSSVSNPTTTPVITLNVPNASGTNRGALTSTDWTTFNNKESALTFSSPLVRTGNTITLPVETRYVQNGTGFQSTSNFYISGTGRATNFGAGIAPNANHGFTGSASTSTTTPFLITPGSGYTGTQNGALWYETTNSRLKMYRSSAADDFIFNRANSLYASAGTRIAMFNNTGDLSATVEYKEIVNISSSASTLSLTNAGFYKFTGTTTTWTLPPISGNSGNKITIINRGSGNITLNSNSGANDIDESMIFMSTTTVATTEIIALYNDGSKWIILP